MTGTIQSTGESQRGAHRISALMQCPALFVLSYLLNLEPKEPRPALALGTCNHAGLAAYYSGEDPLAAIMYVDARSAFKAMDAVNIVDKYRARFPIHRDAEGRICDVEGAVIFVEKEFELTIEEQTMTRRLDLGLERDGVLRLLDHKGSSRPSSRARQGDLDPVIYTQEMLGRRIAKEMGLRWGGFYLNILPTANQGDFGRVPISYTQDFLNRAERSLLRWLRFETFVMKSWNAGEIDPWKLAAETMSSQCYPNGFRCDYMPLCQEGKMALGRFVKKERE